MEKTMTPKDMVEEFATTMGQSKDAILGATLIGEEYHEWETENRSMFDIEHNRYEPRLELKELSDLVYVIYGYARARGWDLDEAVRRVHQNNMERCVWPDGSVKKREDGKVLKNPDAKPIDLSDLV